MALSIHDTRFCREEAGRVYQLALETKAPQARMEYLKLAADWDLLAGEIDYRLGTGGEPCFSGSQSLLARLAPSPTGVFRIEGRAAR
jgi:hypothetical protein